MRFLNNSRGITLIENLVALGILGVVGLGITSSMVFYKTRSIKTQVDAESIRQINNVIENIRPNLANQQISFDLKSEDDIDNRLKAETLEMAWSIDFIGLAKDCKKCPGRFGYVITEVDGYKGLFQVTLRFTHIDWGDNHRDYKVILSGI
ncbi:MAG: type II secretion system protein [Bdellovibrionia bacterium]